MIGDEVLESGNGRNQTLTRPALLLDAVLARVHHREMDRMNRTGTLAIEHIPAETHTWAARLGTGNLEPTTGTQKHHHVKHLDVSCPYRRTNLAARARTRATRKNKNHRRRRHQTSQFAKKERLARARGDAENECYVEPLCRLLPGARRCVLTFSFFHCCS